MNEGSANALVCGRLPRASHVHRVKISEAWARWVFWAAVASSRRERGVWRHRHGHRRLPSFMASHRSPPLLSLPLPTKRTNTTSFFFLERHCSCTALTMANSGAYRCGQVELPPNSRGIHIHLGTGYCGNRISSCWSGEGCRRNEVGIRTRLGILGSFMMPSADLSPGFL